MGGLQLDGYSKQRNIAFEYQGKQHAEFTPYFHKSTTDFEKQVKRDKFKQNICEQERINLIYNKYGKLNFYGLFITLSYQ